MTAGSVRRVDVMSGSPHAAHRDAVYLLGKLSTKMKWRRALQKAGSILIELDAEGGPSVRLHAPKG
jgi:hypothetical protein